MTTDTGAAAAGPSHRRFWLGVIVGSGMVVGWLVLTAQEPEGKRQFFGLWRGRHVLVALALLWAVLATCSALRSRRLLFAVLFGSILAGSTLVLLEVIGLAGLVSYPDLFKRTAKGALGLQPIPHLDLKGETRPDTASRLGLPHEPISFHYRTDRRGFRNHSGDREEADIYLVGDSILVAGLLPFEETVTARLEKSSGLTTMNICLIGLSPQEEHQIFLDADLPVDGKVVQHFIFEGNDLRDSERYRVGRPRDDTEQLSPSRRTFLFNALMAIQKLTQPTHPDAHRYVGQLHGEQVVIRWHPGKADPAEIDPVLESLARFRRDVEDRGGTYAVVYVPSKLRTLGPDVEWGPEAAYAGFDESSLGPFRQRVTEWCAGQGVSFLDLTEPLQSAVKNGEVPWFPGDTHPNAIGHRVMADTLAKWPVLTKGARD